MVEYYSLGKKRQLNQIVFAGAHDAGISSGASNVRTQALDILGQAMAGVRFFDIRIAGSATGKSTASNLVGGKLRAYHAPSHSDKTIKVGLKGTNATADFTKSRLAVGGEFGLELTDMLQQARNFVHSSVGSTEFLILKFDKCTNWQHIADACEHTLGLAMFTTQGNLNTRTLEDLRGKVVVLFSEKGIAELTRPVKGILGFKNLSEDPGGYAPAFNGLQYYGKGGTSISKPFKKLKQNIKKQGKLVEGASALNNPEVVGMMYWTTTGIFESIKSRDKKMWDAPNIAKMKALWGQGLSDFVDGRLATRPITPLAGGAQRKRHFPNIVMIDFADANRCSVIRGLNDLTAAQLADLT